MWYVSLPWEDVYLEHYDRESPWGVTVLLKDDITLWSDHQFGDDWDYDDDKIISANGVTYLVSFCFPRKRDAILFKMMWKR